MAVIWIDIVKGLGLLTLLAIGFVSIRSYAENLLRHEVRDALFGLMFGLVIAVVMLDPIRLPEGATFDPRGGPAILAGVFGGPIGALVAAIIGSLVRYYVVGGPFALGGVAGFVLYGVFGAVAGVIINRSGAKIGPALLATLGALGSLAVLPAFFVSADFATGIAILSKAGPVLVVNNVLGTLIVGLFLVRAKEWSDMRRRLADEQLENSRLALIARETNTGVIITDRAGLTEWSNNAFVVLSGYSNAALAGRKPGDLLQGKDTDPATIATMSAAIKAGEAFDVEVVNYHKSGEPYWVQIHCEPFIDPDGSEKFMATQSDITARKEAEKLKSQFVSLVNHELRTPLTSIIGSVGLIRSGKLGSLPPKVTDMIEIASSNSDRLLELINDILDFESIQSGHIEYSFQDVDLGELVDSTIELNAAFADQFDVKLVRGDAQAQVFVRGDKRRLLQVLTNLISNASKFAPPKSAVTVTLSVNETHARLDVADLGNGVPEKFRSKIFERFSQAESGDDRTIGGSGLGLSISKGIVEAHDGEIGFTPNNPTGAVFFIRLPITGPV